MHRDVGRGTRLRPAPLRGPGSRCGRDDSGGGEKRVKTAHGRSDSARRTACSEPSGAQLSTWAAREGNPIYQRGALLHVRRRDLLGQHPSRRICAFRDSAARIDWRECREPYFVFAVPRSFHSRPARCGSNRPTPRRRSCNIARGFLALGLRSFGRARLQDDQENDSNNGEHAERVGHAVPAF